MSRLMKFVETGTDGEGRGRAAYVMDESALPEAGDGMEWRSVDTFNAADELLKHPGIKEVFKAALDKGCALVAKPARIDPIN